MTFEQRSEGNKRAGPVKESGGRKVLEVAGCSALSRDGGHPGGWSAENGGVRDKGEAGEHTGVGQAGMRPRPSPCAAREVLESSDPSRGWSVGIKVRSRAAGQKEPLISWGWGEQVRRRRRRD